MCQSILHRVIYFLLCILGAGALRSIKIENDTFLLNNQPFAFASGDLHYTRVPRAYWRDRLVRMRALGLNTVQTYVVWAQHQPLQNNVSFEGQLDLAAFLKTAQSVGLLVLLRIGPYVDAEIDYGGLPAWLLTQTPSIQQIRSSDAQFVTCAEKWWGKLLPRIRPFLYTNGGPVAMVQIENEFGAFSTGSPADKAYLAHLMSLAQSSLGRETILYTTDGSRLPEMQRGSITGSGLYSAVDFGPGDPDYGGAAEIERAFAAQKAMNPVGRCPLMCTEFYAGWITYWHDNATVTTSTKALAVGLQALVAKNASFNLYMAHGGSTFGFWTGADADYSATDAAGRYVAVETSYDYNAPIDEQGRHGIGSDGLDKFDAIRTILAAYQLARAIAPLVPEPAPIPTADFGVVSFMTATALLQPDTLAALLPTGPVHSKVPVPMERLHQYYGFILYTTTITITDSRNEPTTAADHAPNAAQYTLRLPAGARDRVVALVDGEEVGVVWRGAAVNDTLVFHLPATAASATAAQRKHTEERLHSANNTKTYTLQLLVENTGRIAYGSAEMSSEKRGKGIDTVVHLNNQTLGPWRIYPLSLNGTQMGKFHRGWWQLQDLGAAAGAQQGLKRPAEVSATISPVFLQANFTIKQGSATNDSSIIPDTFIHFGSSWHKGVVWINGVNLGRFWEVGPQRSLFLPGPMLKWGLNKLTVLELHQRHSELPKHVSLLASRTSV
jgi:beta-galactosidase